MYTQLPTNEESLCLPWAAHMHTPRYVMSFPGSSPPAFAPGMLQEPYTTIGSQNEVRESWGCGEVGGEMGRENKQGLVSAGK